LRFSISEACEEILRSLFSNLISLVILQVAFCAWPQFIWSAPQAASPQQTQSASGDRVVLTVGDRKMTAADVDKFIESLPFRYRVFYGGPGKHLLPQYLARTEILAVEAAKQKLDQQPDVVRALELVRENILADAAREHIEKGVAITDAELQELYKTDKSLSEDVHVSHILIRTAEAPDTNPGQYALPEAQAREKLEGIRQRIVAGANFAEMASQYSEDRATASSGGDMGFIKRDRVVPPIFDAAYTLDPGQVSGIISTPYGLEIIKLEEKRVKSFADVKPALEEQIRETKANEIIDHLMQSYSLYFDKDFFSAPAAKAASPASQPAPPAKAASPPPQPAPPAPPPSH
jgi:parvulin-like peptidyl-prolyl isomerase